MAYNPQIHNRRSIRLKDYDYSQKGLYFLTICCQSRISYFGKIENGKMILNDAGKMIETWYWELGNKFSDIQCHEMVVMPNHFHCIIENIGTKNKKNVGADLCVCPKNQCVCPKNQCVCPKTNKNLDKYQGEHIGSPLHDVVRWFKTMTTNAYIRGVKNMGWQRFNRKLWQRNYWEHIIRNEKSLEQIANYIYENPMRWQQDKLFNK